ncbi:hypothetical protein HYS97_02735 [Candidatus Daviesbacteria bacterium]|nr:hypothetical protein [Candidatus Daviesbacteria bacterium]
MDDKKKVVEELVEILSKASQNKIYGSVEVYFEAGSITQITQRIINKVSNKTNSKQTQPKQPIPSNISIKA